MRELTFGLSGRDMILWNLIITRKKLMLAGYSKMRRGGGGATRSRGLKPLLRKLILLDFLGFYSMNILSIKHKINSPTDAKLRRIILLRGHSFLNHLTPSNKGLIISSWR
jgi:hypothetical protein